MRPRFWGGINDLKSVRDIIRPRLRSGGYPHFSGVFEPLARVTLYLTDENGLDICFVAD